jgi:hypothetical protein
VQNILAEPGEVLGQLFNLGGFARAVGAFKSDEHKKRKKEEGRRKKEGNTSS